MSITVYTKSGFCPMCMATERTLVSAGIEFNEVHLEDVDQTQTQIEEWKTALGMSAPIVVTDTEAGSWSGFRPDKIDQLKSVTETVKAA